VPDLDQVLKRNAPPVARQVVRGRIATTPTNPADDLYVTIQSFDGSRAQFGPCHWAPAEALPERGDDCLVLFDESDEPWVIVTALPGAVSMRTEVWTWTTKTADAGTSGQIGNNVATWDATALNVNEHTTDNRDVSRLLDGIVVGNALDVQQKTDATRWARYRVTAAPIDNGGWRAYPVALVDSSGAAPGGNADTMLTWMVSV
jgi:hypothetical protein